MRNERAVKPRDPQPGQEYRYPQIHGQGHNPVYPAQLQQVKTQKEADCGDYCCAFCCSPCFVGQKRGCCGGACWINILLSCCFPCGVIHACTMLNEPDYKEASTHQPVVVVEPIRPRI